MWKQKISPHLLIRPIKPITTLLNIIKYRDRERTWSIMRGMMGGHHIHYPRYYDDITLGGEILRTILSLPGLGSPSMNIICCVLFIKGVISLARCALLLLLSLLLSTCPPSWNTKIQNNVKNTVSIASLVIGYFKWIFGASLESWNIVFERPN